MFIEVPHEKDVWLSPEVLEVYRNPYFFVEDKLSSICRSSRLIFGPWPLFSSGLFSWMDVDVWNPHDKTLARLALEGMNLEYRDFYQGASLEFDQEGWDYAASLATICIMSGWEFQVLDARNNHAIQVNHDLRVSILDDKDRSLRHSLDRKNLRK